MVRAALPASPSLLITGITRQHARCRRPPLPPFHALTNSCGDLTLGASDEKLDLDSQWPSDAISGSTSKITWPYWPFPPL